MERELFRRVLLTLVFALSWFACAPGPAFSQTSNPNPSVALWSAPINLSRSGAASKPMAFVAPDGTLQAFWWDRFDGLTTAIRRDDTWSEPLTVRILITEVMNEKTVVHSIEAMPTLVADTVGYVHAFWQDKPDPDTRLRPLLHSRLAVGTTDWSAPDTVSAANAVAGEIALDVVPTSDGGLVLAYVREAHTSGGAPGLYTRRLDPQGVWNAARLVYPSLYLRLLDPGSKPVRLVVASDGALYLTWADIALGRPLYARSSDAGATWSDPVSINAAVLAEAQGASLAGPGATNLRVAPLPAGGALLVYEVPSSGCLLYQQREEEAVVSMAPSTPSETLTSTVSITLTEALTATTPITPSATLTATTTVESASPGEDASALGGVQLVLDSARPCPLSDRFWLHEDRLFWVWGEGTEQLTLLAWDPARTAWSKPWSPDLRLRQPDSERWLAWDALRLGRVADSVFVLGTDMVTGDVWLTLAPLQGIELAYAAPSPWSQVEVPVEWRDDGAPGADGLTLAIDSAGITHAAWVSTQDGGVGAILYYAQWDGARWSRPVEIIRTITSGELLRHPSLLTDAQGLLHLAWSGGEAGQIFYSRSKLAEATSAGWSNPQELPIPGRVVPVGRGTPEPTASGPRVALPPSSTLAGDWPLLGMDASGRLTILYVAPINEARGVYAVQSPDAGLSWSVPSQVFDAAAADWAAVDHPALAVARDGALHVAWVRAGMPGAREPQGIYYAWSAAGQDNVDPWNRRWSEPVRLAEAGFDWPHLAWVRGDVHLLYGRESDGSVWHRWTDAAPVPLPSASISPVQGASPSPTALDPSRNQGLAWKPAARVPGWQNMALPLGLGLAGDTLYLAGIDRGGTPFYATWEHTAAASPRWSAAETFWLGPEVVGGLSASVAVAPLGGQLALALRVQWAAISASSLVAKETDREGDGAPTPLVSEGSAAGVRLLGAMRPISTVDPATQPTWVPTPRPTATSAPMPTAMPSPTLAPDLGGPLATSQSSLTNLLFGGGLAGLLVLLIIGARGLFGRRS